MVSVASRFFSANRAAPRSASTTVASPTRPISAHTCRANAGRGASGPISSW